MRLTLRYFALLGILLLSASFFLPALYHGDYPHAAGPSFDKNASRQYLREFERNRPEVILLGDSMLTKGVDLATFQARTGKSTYKVDIPGSSSVLWYIVVHSDVVEADPAPQTLVILFRDGILTAPTFRTTGPYFDLIDKFASPDDTLALQRAYLTQLTPLQSALEGYFPPITYRNEILTKLDGGLRHLAPRWLGCDRDCADYATSLVLGDMRPEVVNASIRSAEKVLYTPEQLNFHSQVDSSFLPEIIRLARKRGIQLIFVRAPTQLFDNPSDEPPALSVYLGDLQEYLAAQDIPMIDLSQPQGIGPAQFSDPHHLTPEGKAIFTPIFSDAVKKYLR